MTTFEHARDDLGTLPVMTFEHTRDDLGTLSVMTLEHSRDDHRTPRDDLRTRP